MEKKINYWATIWNEEVSIVHNGNNLYWFTIKSKSILRSGIDMLEKITNTKVYSIDITDEGELQIWLDKE